EEAERFLEAGQRVTKVAVVEQRAALAHQPLCLGLAVGLTVRGLVGRPAGERGRGAQACERAEDLLHRVGLPSVPAGATGAGDRAGTGAGGAVAAGDGAGCDAGAAVGAEGRGRSAGAAAGAVRAGGGALPDGAAMGSAAVVGRAVVGAGPTGAFG